MKYRFAIVLLALVMLLVGFNSGYLLGQSPIAPFQVFPTTSPAPVKDEAFTPFWEVYNLIKTRFYEQPLDDNMLAEGAINGMLESLDDPHTRYLSPQDETTERIGFEGELTGIGVEVTVEGDNIIVVSPIEGSPAFEAGLKPGDILREADGVDLTGMSIGEAASLIRGPVGTTVSLLIEREGETFTVDIERGVIELDSVRGEMLDGNIAYVRLSQFGTRSSEEVSDILSELLAQDPDGLILDLRHNPGGALDTVVDVADQFLPKSTVLIQQFADGIKREYNASDKGLAQDIPMVILVDEGSASASEVLAAAIQENGRGILIGQTTFGKGTIQMWEELSNGGGVRITFARWLTPNENWVHEKGIAPDITVSLPDVDNVEDFTDTQLQAAIDYLQGKQVINENETAPDA